MIRPRQFDLNHVRERVTDVFTEHGYRGTSMSMLAEACGMGKQSLYNAIGDKEAAYLQSLECAGARGAMVAQALADAPTGRAALQAFFGTVVEVCVSPDPAQHTCILTAGLMEGIEAEAVAAKLKEKWRGLCAVLEAAIVRGQADGTVRRDVPPAVLRELLTTLFLGLRVSARAGSGRRALETTVAWTMKLLDEGAPLP